MLQDGQGVSRAKSSAGMPVRDLSPGQVDARVRARCVLAIDRRDAYEVCCAYDMETATLEVLRYMTSLEVGDEISGFVSDHSYSRDTAGTHTRRLVAAVDPRDQLLCNCHGIGHFG